MAVKIAGEEADRQAKSQQEFELLNSAKIDTFMKEANEKVT